MFFFNLIMLQIKHNIQWEATIRDLGVLSRNTSFEVREQAGLSLKSSLRHIISIDLRDDLIFPSAGSLLQITSEAAGLGGDVGYLKNEFYVQGNYSIAEDFVSSKVSFEKVVSQVNLLVILFFKGSARNSFWGLHAWVNKRHENRDV